MSRQVYPCPVCQQTARPHTHARVPMAGAELYDYRPTWDRWVDRVPMWVWLVIMGITMVSIVWPRP
jgi:hypothetical protein